MILGCDVSHWEDSATTPQKIDFVKMKNQGAEFVYFKASQGKNYTDNVFLSSWKDAKAAGLIRGAYHYLDWTAPALSQADHFCDVIQSDPGELPPICDYEQYPVVAGCSAWLQAFFDEVEKRTGKISGIYSSPSYWNSYGGKDPKWLKYPLWLANYAIKPTIPLPWKSYMFWQYTKNGDGLKFGCESLSIDLNWFNGTIDDLTKLAGGAVYKICPTCNGTGRVLA
jgi:lysozyme